jgi:ribosome-associated heat shock protein Hsp15
VDRGSGGSLIVLGNDVLVVWRLVTYLFNRPTDHSLAMPLAETRIDKWLWAARFYKTRSLATAAVAGGKIEVNGDGAKPSKSVKPGDRVRIRIGPVEYTITVKAIGERRGSVQAAQALYDESLESRVARERIAAQRRFAAPPAYEEKGKPSKKDRRAMDRLRDR